MGMTRCPRHPPLAGDISDTLYQALTLQSRPRSDTLPGTPQSPPAILEGQASPDSPGRPRNQGVADAHKPDFCQGHFCILASGLCPTDNVSGINHGGVMA